MFKDYVPDVYIDHYLFRHIFFDRVMISLDAAPRFGYRLVGRGDIRIGALCKKVSFTPTGSSKENEFVVKEIFSYR